MNDHPDTTNRGTGWVVCQSVLMVACLGLGWLIPGKWSGEWSALVGHCLALLGALFGVSGVWVLGRNRTIFPEPQPNSVLIEHGVYRLVRHPLYTSVMLLSFAWSFWWQSLPALICAIVMVIFLSAKAANEERRLMKRFPGYTHYMAKTKRFIPWII